MLDLYCTLFLPPPRAELSSNFIFSPGEAPEAEPAEVAAEAAVDAAPAEAADAAPEAEAEKEPEEMTLDEYKALQVGRNFVFMDVSGRAFGKGK